ncbi:MAG TPA: hopanoid-associated sugar epimerase [Geminicoccaceae bacterium]|nr:hopanoid-associated sugar epimerase [Geminicoccaceae bacterium]
MTALVTGATGFVGSAVARRLLQAGEAVRVLVRPTSDRRNLADLPGRAEVAVGDLGDRGSLERALRGCRVLYHVAADYRLWARRPDELYATNVDGTRALLLAAGAAGVERIVYTSSVATLGVPGDGRPGDEGSPVALADMIGHYKRSKFLAEEEVRRLVREHGLPVVIVNPSAPIGPRDVRPTPTGRLVVEAARGRIPAVVDTGLNVVHVDDVALGHLLAFERGRVGERYVLGGHDVMLADLVGRIAAIAGRRPPRFRLPHGAVLPVAYAAEAVARLTGREPLATVDGVRMARKRMFFTSARAERELGYRARPAEEALRDAVAWFGANGYLG